MSSSCCGTINCARAGGNGPDYDAWVAARRVQQELSLSTSIEIAQGIIYGSPPKFLPGLPERYQSRQ